jgi:hypothetical protein
MKRVKAIIEGGRGFKRAIGTVDPDGTVTLDENKPAPKVEKKPVKSEKAVD